MNSIIILISGFQCICKFVYFYHRVKLKFLLSLGTRENSPESRSQLLLPAHGQVLLLCLGIRRIPIGFQIFGESNQKSAI